MRYKNARLVPQYILGRGSLGQLEEVLATRKIDYSSGQCAVYLIDHFFNGKNLLQLPLRPEDLVLYVDTTHEPHTEDVDLLVAQMRKSGRSVQAVIGIGGGSTLDTAKIASILLNNPGKAEDYQGWDLVQKPGVYKVGIPTIAGTGAEFTRTAVVTSPKKKLGVNSDASVFDQVILDAELLKTVPTDQFIYSAMDCFVHNEESLLGRINDTMTIALAEKSSQMLQETLLGELDHEKLLIASSFGGIAVANSSVGICHPFSYGLGSVLGLHHGYSICIAFNQLGEYYPRVAMFKEILAKHKVTLPKIVTPQTPDDVISRMADAVLLNERPLSNAFGENWREKFSKTKVIELLKRM